MALQSRRRRGRDPAGLTQATLTVDPRCGALSGVPQGAYSAGDGYGLVPLTATPAIPRGTLVRHICVMASSLTLGDGSISLSNGNTGTTITVNLGSLSIAGDLYSTGATSPGCCYLTASCASGYTTANGWCTPFTCPQGSHDGGTGQCVPTGTCSSGFMLDMSGDCVASSACSSPPIANAGGSQSVTVSTPVTLDGSQSSGGSGGLTYAWSLTTKPSGSTAALSSASGVAVSFTPDLAGTYTATLLVTDGTGCMSQSTTTTISAGAAGTKVRLVIKTTWDAGHGDADLHYLHPGGSFLDYGTNGGDCMAFNTNPDWGPTGPDGSTANNPTFGAAQPTGQNADQHWGGSVGESVGQPVSSVTPNLFDGTYTAVVHYYCSRQTPGVSASAGSITATIHVLVNGTEVYTTSHTLNQRDIWPAAAITVSNGGTTARRSPRAPPLFLRPVCVSTSMAMGRIFGGCTADTN